MKTQSITQNQIFENPTSLNELFNREKIVGLRFPSSLNPVLFIKELMSNLNIKDEDELKDKISIPQENFIYYEDKNYDSPDIIDIEKVEYHKLNTATKILEFALILCLCKNGIYSPESEVILTTSSLNRVLILCDIKNFYMR